MTAADRPPVGTPGGRRPVPWKRVLAGAVLTALVAAAVALRWLYVERISLFFDEYITIYAAKTILQRGVPLFPSGNFYTHGILFNYLLAPVLGAFGLNEAILRLPSLLLSVGTVVLVFFAGRRLFSTTAGLVAAAAAALDPEAIAWGARARMYTLLQLLVLLATWVFYRAAIEDDRPRLRWLAIGLVVAAMLAQVEAALLLPALGLALVAARGVRWCLRPSVLAPFLVGLAAFAAIVSGANLGEASHLEQIGEVRPYLTLPGSNLLAGFKSFAPALLDVWRLPFTLLAVAGLFYLFRRPGRSSPLVYSYMVLAVVLGELLFLAGPTWRVPRYAFMLLPILWLIAGAVVGRWLRPAWAGAVASLGLAALVGVTGYASAFTQEWGYDRAFRHVQGQWQPGDVVLTTHPPASMLYLDHCDYYVMQLGWGEDLMQGAGGVQVDRWTGTPLLNSVEQLRDVLAAGPRVWLVVDGWRFQSWFENEFIRTVLDQMVPVYDERGMAVFLGEGYTEPTPPVLAWPVMATFGDELALERVDLPVDSLQAGGRLEVSLAWHSLASTRPAYTVFLHLVGRDGARVAQVDEPLLGGFYQPTVWPKGETVLDRHTVPVPADLPAGRYRLDMGLYRPGSREAVLLAKSGADRVALGYLDTTGLSTPMPQVPLEADLGGQIRLLGYSLACEPPSERCTVRLYWQAITRPDASYTVFVHLVGQEGHAVAQHDGLPEGGFYPTNAWQVGETIEDEHPLAIEAGLPAGDYPLIAGLYLLETGQRLQVVDAGGRPVGDSVTLTTIRLPGP
ncbi:MAG TPA: glycosyltransferase family 39 protein [Anaerolineae bacterium]|nr:glycosyltransferase family 39 protein [Anaerolineae bacterium]